MHSFSEGQKFMATVIEFLSSSFPHSKWASEFIRQTGLEFIRQTGAGTLEEEQGT
jgi:hypothetical protein